MPINVKNLPMAALQQKMWVPSWAPSGRGEPVRQVEKGSRKPVAGRPTTAFRNSANAFRDEVSSPGRRRCRRAAVSGQRVAVGGRAAPPSPASLPPHPPPFGSPPIHIRI